MKKISDIYGIVRESRERIIKTMQERGITELATILPYSEWCKQEECEPEEKEDDDDAYIDYKDQEAEDRAHVCRLTGGVRYHD